MNLNFLFCVDASTQRFCYLILSYPSMTEKQLRGKVCGKVRTLLMVLAAKFEHTCTRRSEILHQRFTSVSCVSIQSHIYTLCASCLDGKIS